jgi:hypothetical protein
MNQKYAYLKKPYKKEKLDVYENRLVARSFSHICIFCGYNSKRIGTEFCPICKETLIGYHTDIKLPRFKSKMWDKFVNHVLACQLHWKLNIGYAMNLRKNWPTKVRFVPVHILIDDIPDLKYYNIKYCLENNICPNVDFMCDRDKCSLQRKDDIVLY